MQRLVCSSLREYREDGYSPFITLLIEDGAIDMLPMDLIYPTPANGYTFSFDWRTFFCTLFFELCVLKRAVNSGVSPFTRILKKALHAVTRR